MAVARRQVACKPGALTTPHRPAGRPDHAHAPARALLAWAVLCVCAVRGAAGLNLPQSVVHYEYKKYSVIRSGLSGLVLPVVAKETSLIVIETEEESEVVAELLGSRQGVLPLVWSDEHQRLEWQHRGGPTPFTPTSYRNFVGGLTYEEVVDEAKEGSCFSISSCRKGGRWFVHPARQCDNGFDYVVETPSDTRGSFRSGSSFYYISDVPDTRNNAFASARAMDMLSYPGRLVTLDSAEENAALAAALTAMGIDVAFTAGALLGTSRMNAHEQWAWRSPTDSTRAPKRFLDRDTCTVLDSSYVNFASMAAACRAREKFSALLLTASGEWDIQDERDTFFASQHHYIVEFPTVRGWSRGHILFRDKAYQYLGSNRTLAASKRLAASATYMIRGYVQSGHLPAVGTLAERLLIERLIRERIDRSTCPLRLNGFWAASEHSGREARWAADAGLLAGVPFLPASASPTAAFDPTFFFDTVNQCLSIHGAVWRLANCSDVLPAVAQFDLHSYKGAHYRELPTRAGFYGAVQDARMPVDVGGTLRGSLITFNGAEDRQFLDFVMERSDIEALFLGYYLDPQTGRFENLRDLSLLYQIPPSVAKSPVVLDKDVFGTAVSLDQRRLKACVSYRFSLGRIETSGCVFEPRVLMFAYHNNTVEDNGTFADPDFCIAEPAIERCDCENETFVDCFGTGFVRPPRITQLVSRASLIANSFSTLRKADLQSYDHIRELSLRTNAIAAIEPDVFASGFPNLELLGLEFNRLSEVPFLSKLRSLTELELGSNFISELPSGRLPVSLQTLSISQNVLTTIAAGALEELTALVVLDLTENRLGSFRGATLQRLLDNNVELRASLNPCFDEPDRLQTCNVETATRTTAVPAGPPGSSSSGVSPALVAGVVVAVLLVLAVVAVAVRRRQADKGRVTAAHMQLGEGGAVPMQVNALHAAEQWDNRVIQFLPEHIEFGKQLGSGAFGNVHRGRIVQRKQRLDVAVKSLNEAYSIDREAQRLFLREARIMAGLQHDNVVRLHGICMTPAPLIVLEYMSNSDLQSYLREHNTRLSAVRLHGFCRDVASGMAYLQSKNIVHRDLAARNVLLNEELVAKLADLGLARDLQDEDYYRKISNDPLPVRWMAPESLSDRLYVLKTDVWSYAVTVWEIYSLGETPFPQLSTAQVLRVVLSGTTPLECPTLCPPSTYKVMLECWRFDPPQRPDFVAIERSLASHSPVLEFLEAPRNDNDDDDETSI